MVAQREGKRDIITAASSLLSEYAIEPEVFGPQYALPPQQARQTSSPRQVQRRASKEPSRSERRAELARARQGARLLAQPVQIPLGFVTAYDRTKDRWFP